MIPVEDHKWTRIPEDYFLLPDKHYAEVADTEEGMVVRIVGPNAHVFGKGKILDDAADAALAWFYRVGGSLR